ncbi:MAG: hypothetical protein RLZZ450_6735 [Pseudomonadota bacterium]|jgi:hypothetical protein
MSDRASPSSRLLVRVGLCLWLSAGLACVWEVLALQPPDSPLHLGVLAGPIAQLASISFGLGTVHIIVGYWWSSLYTAGEGKLVAWLLAIGAIVQVLALLYAASRGLMAVQLLDPRLDARMALYARGFGHGLTLAGGIIVLLRAVRR